MPVNGPISGYTDTFPDDVLLDSGVLYLGATVLACLRGGLKFDPGKVIRDIPFDGRRSPLKELDRTQEFRPKLTGTMIELPTDTIAVIEPGATVAVTGGWTGATSYKPKIAGNLYAAGDYLANVRAVWKRGGGNLFQCFFPCGIVNKYDITSQDNDENQIAIEIEGRLDMSVSGTNLGDAPYRLEYLETL